MSLLPSAARGPAWSPAPQPLVLVVDDDRRVLELLQVALTAHQFRVITAADGDEAIRRALAERPDLIVLDVRLPKKSGLEVCDFLRHDPDDPQVPVILVSAAADTESRLDGLARGADDYLAKPFSPKELIARVRRLLTRAGDARIHRRRASELERDLSRAQNEVLRATGESRRERRLRESALALGRDLERAHDPDQVALRVLAAAHAELGASALALLEVDAATEQALPVAARGDAFERFAGLALPVRGDFATLIAGLGRPVRATELQRFPELRDDLLRFASAGISLFAPLHSTRGLEALLVAADREDGRAFAAEDVEAIATLSALAGGALYQARRFRRQLENAVALLVSRAPVGERGRMASAEAASLAEHTARQMQLPSRERALLSHAAGMGAWGWSEDGRRTLAMLAADDPTGWVGDLAGLVAEGEALADHPEDVSPERRQATLVLGVAARYAVARGAGRSAHESWATSMAWIGPALEPRTREALEAAFTQWVAESGRAA